MAVGLRVEPVFTRDVDLALSVDGDAHAERVVADLGRLGYRVVQAFERTATGTLTLVRLMTPGSTAGTPEVDLLFSLCGIESEIAAASESMDLRRAGLVPVARLGHLIAMKVLSAGSGRSRDREDLSRMIPLASDREVERAREAVRWMQERGYGGKRDLSLELESALKLRS